MTKRERMYKKIENHGQALIALFPNAIHREPVKISKALMRVETSLKRPIEDACNGRITGDELETILARTMKRIEKMLGTTDGVFINTDPR